MRHKTESRKAMPLRLSTEERARAEALADAWGITIADAIRRLIREAPEPRRSQKD